MIENILMIPMLSSLRYLLFCTFIFCFLHMTILCGTWCIRSIFSLALALQGYDSIPKEIPDPKAKEVS